MTTDKESTLLASAEMGEYNDCSVIALALTTHLSYNEAHRLMSSCGRVNNEGAHYETWVGAFDRAGYRLRDITKLITASRAFELNGEPFFKYGNTYVVYIDGHLLPIRQRKVYDWAYNTNYKVREVYEVVRKRPPTLNVGT